MALVAGTYSVGPDSGTLRVRTYRDGVAQMAGHDLVIDVGDWQATVEVGDEGAPAAIALRADPRALRVRDGLGGVKPLTDADREEIRSTINAKILRGHLIEFESSGTELTGGRLKVEGELAIAGSSRPVMFELELSGDGRISGTLSVIQSEWGIKPYRTFMGALKVRDDVEVVVAATLPSS
jgi:polyisoprenoid-binding protein YceI